MTQIKISFKKLKLLIIIISERIACSKDVSDTVDDVANRFCMFAHICGMTRQEGIQNKDMVKISSLIIFRGELTSLGER